MKLRARLRSISFQLLVGVVSLELLSLVLFAWVMVRQQHEEIINRVEQRLVHQANIAAFEAEEALEDRRPDLVGLSVDIMAKSPSVASSIVTDGEGRILFAANNTADRPVEEQLRTQELVQMGRVTGDAPVVFSTGPNEWEGVAAIHYKGRLYGYAWVHSDRVWDNQQLELMLHSAVVFGMIWIGASIVLVLAMARSITRPLSVLHDGTQALMLAPETPDSFPLPVLVHNEIGDLIEAFNRMVASIEEQRAGLSDTLSLLDSMLANAPIGFAFFDRQARFVRVNRIFAEMTEGTMSGHLGRTLAEVLPEEAAGQLTATIQRVFKEDRPIRDIELSGAGPAWNWTWIANAYPIRTLQQQVRWVGVIVLDATDRKRSEEALRKTEKLAATGRLAASIAHEINNPLEAITNLLYLVSNHAGLEEPALGWVRMAEHEVKRVAEITQQTLRFYRQSTQAARTKLSELVGSVLSLHQVRLQHRDIRVEKQYDPEMDLHCFAGEIRQVFANLIGNAIDSMPEGGRLLVRARRTMDRRNPGQMGVRFTVADTGCGIAPEARKHIFEAFFTTKEVTGTGLGLWVSSEIIAKHNGWIRVRSRQRQAHGGGSGTVFALFLPDVEPTQNGAAETRMVEAAGA